MKSFRDFAKLQEATNIKLKQSYMKLSGSDEGTIVDLDKDYVYYSTKKGEKKIKKNIFKSQYIMNESPVGSVGRTKDSEALAHIESSDLAKKFRKIVKELGGKNVARQLLAGMNQKGEKVTTVTEGKMPKTMSPQKFLRDLGYKIKKENFEKYSFDLEFFNEKDSKEAYEDLCDEGFLELYNITRVGKVIAFEDK